MSSEAEQGPVAARGAESRSGGGGDLPPRRGATSIFSGHYAALALSQWILFIDLRPDSRRLADRPKKGGNAPLGGEGGRTPQSKGAPPKRAGQKDITTPIRASQRERPYKRRSGGAPAK